MSIRNGNGYMNSVTRKILTRDCYDVTHKICVSIGQVNNALPLEQHSHDP